MPEVRVCCSGRLDEDPVYVGNAEAMVARLGLGRRVDAHRAGEHRGLSRPRVDVVVLTSLSEAQPLVLLEAGAAGVPCVATDVGACREIIEGARGEDPAFGPGGHVTSVVATEEIARSALSLLTSPERATAFGANLRARVLELYRADHVARAYAELYEPVAEAAESLDRELA